MFDFFLSNYISFNKLLMIFNFFCYSSQLCITYTKIVQFRKTSIFNTLMHIFNKYLFYENIHITRERKENNLLYKIIHYF